MTVPAPAMGALKLQIATPRRVQATFSDVARLEVSLELANGNTRQRTISEPDLTESPSLTFDELASGLATVSVAAFDAPGRSLGDASATASILTAQTVTATVSLDLAPGFAFATPAPPPTL